MRKAFDASLQELHNDILRMGSLSEEQIYNCVEALVKKDINLADDVIKKDDIVDDMDKEIEDKCVRLIAMQQPIATDLRTIFITLKIVTDLERIADYAVDIAKVAKRLKNENYIKDLIDIPKMAEIVEKMIKESLDAYVEENADKAYKVCKIDDSVDALYKNVFKDFLLILDDKKENMNQVAQFLFVCKYLERVADHTTNICESVIYLVTGEKVDLNE